MNKLIVYDDPYKIFGDVEEKLYLCHGILSEDYLSWNNDYCLIKLDEKDYAEENFHFILLG